MNRESGLNLKLENGNSVRVVREFGQAIEDTGKRTDETSEKLKRLQTTLTGVGENLLLQKRAAAGLAAALRSLNLDPPISGGQGLSSAQNSTARTLPQAAPSAGLKSSPLDNYFTGLVGYQKGQSRSTGTASSTFENAVLNTFSSGLVAGPFGAAVSGLMGSLMHRVEESEPELPSFNLLWKTIDGQIASVAETWQNMGRDPKIVAAVEEVWQSQLDFMKKLAVVAGGEEVPDVDFSLGGIGRSIEDILNQQTVQGLIKVALGSFGQLSEVFGTGFQEELKDIFMETMTGNLGLFVYGYNRDVLQSYLDWKFNQFTGLPPGQAMSAFEDWMNSQDIFSPIGRPGILSNSIFDLFLTRHPGVAITEEIFPQLEQFARSVIPGWFNRGEIALGSAESQTPWKEFFTDLNQQVNGIFDLVTAGMGQAFTASLKTGEFQTFEENFKQSILNSVQQSLIKGFAEQEFLPIIFQPFYGTDSRPALSEVLKQYISGNLPLDQAQGFLTQMAGELSSALLDFQPFWETLNTAFQGLREALGLNTEALGQNTTALTGTVDNFLMSLDTGSLAPAESMARLETLRGELYASALADPEAFSSYARFMTSQYLPWRQEVSTDYSTEVASVRAGVESIPWVQEIRSKSLGITGAGGLGGQQAQWESISANSARDIGREVSQALAPMLLDLKESGQITINVVVDGQIIRQKVLESLDDPTVVQKARSRI
ncbi:MAG: hypothetical protein AB1611_00510 [bacterium]